MGKNSGYSLTDILYFHLKINLMTIVSKLRYEKLNTFIGSMGRRRGYNHIINPFSYYIDKLLNRKPFYFYCEKCDWMQYKINKCNLCMDMLHPSVAEGYASPWVWQCNLVNGEMILEKIKIEI